MARRQSGSAEAHRVVVVGGGFSGAAFAVQLLRRTRVPLHVCIIEPREHLGRGLAYSTIDPDHRLNGPLGLQAIDPERPEDLRRWCAEGQVQASDPEGIVPSGRLFLRRSVLGEFLSAQVALSARDGNPGSTLDHVRDTATGIVATGEGLRVSTAAHGDLDADMVVLATGNPVPALRKPFAPEHARHPRIVANPLEAGSLDAIPADAQVLVIGSGLTALDMLSTLLRKGHRGKITVVSRRGLRPRGQSPEILGAVASNKPPVTIMAKVNAPIPEFIAREPLSIRRWCRALRLEIARVAAEGGSWHGPFDSVRDVVWKLWPQLPLAEQQRFLRRLRFFYDIHRFRTPPMNERMANQAEQEGRVQYLAASVARVEAEPGATRVEVELDVRGDEQARQRHSFDYVVNCTGLDAGAPSSTNPLLARLEDQGMLRPHATGLGYDVTAQCEAIDSRGDAQRRLRVVGPPTAGVFGDPLGAIYIALQIQRMLPDAMAALAGHAAPVAADA